MKACEAAQLGMDAQLRQPARAGRILQVYLLQSSRPRSAVLDTRLLPNQWVSRILARRHGMHSVSWEKFLIAGPPGRLASTGD